MWRTRVLLAAASIAVACDGNVQNTTAWPVRVVHGQTVSMAIDSNYASPGMDQWDLSNANVTVLLDWGGVGSPFEVSNVRVIESSPHPAVDVTSLPPGWNSSARSWVAIVVFDIPDENVILPADLPATTTVQVLKDGNAIPTGFGAGEIETEIEIVDDATIFPPTLFPKPSDLEPPPLLRLVGIAGSGKFADPAWLNSNIGSIEFEVEHIGLTLTDAYPIADAAGATVVVGPGNGADRTKIVLVEPDGFELNEDTTNRPDLAGDGPFLDIAFAAGTPFEETDFTFYDLVVADVDGVVLIDQAGPAIDFFAPYIRGPRP